MGLAAIWFAFSVGNRDGDWKTLWNPVATPLSPQLFLPKPQFGLKGQYDPFSTLGGQDFCENTLEPFASFIRQIWKEEAFMRTTLNDKEDYYSGSSQTFNMSLLKRLTIPKWN